MSAVREDGWLAADILAVLARAVVGRARAEGCVGASAAVRSLLRTWAPLVREWCLTDYTRPYPCAKILVF